MKPAEENRVAPTPSMDGETSSRIVSMLDTLLDALDVAWPASAPLRRRASDLRRRWRDARLQLAVIGQFKRGKSTFLNALLGQPLLPTGVIPLTSIPTFIAWGPTPLVRVTYRTNRPAEEFYDATPDQIRRRLSGFVAEEANPQNRLGVERVELRYPATILTSNVVLVDTPGIGSTHRHNSDAALQVLPECDAAIFVVSADPPITEAELVYLETVRPTLASIFFIFNKADYLTPDELEAAAAFLSTTLERALPGSAAPGVFCLSALRGLKAKQVGDVKAVDDSGLGAIEERILNYLAREKMASLANAVRRKAGELVSQAAADLSLRVRALEIPVEDLERRRGVLEDSLGRVSHETRTMHDLLVSDRRRTVERMEQQASDLRDKARRYLGAIVDRALSQSVAQDMEGASRTAIAAAIPDFFQQELGRNSREFSELVEKILDGHQRRIDDLVSLVRRTAADLFEVPYATATATDRFKLGNEPYWIMEPSGDRLVTIPSGMLNRMLPAKARCARLRRQLHEQVADLVDRNVENLRWATLQGLDDTFRRFATSLDERLTEAMEATRGAVIASATKRAAASHEAEAEIVPLRRALGALAALHSELNSLREVS
jgi:Dynamin family